MSTDSDRTLAGWARIIERSGRQARGEDLPVRTYKISPWAVPVPANLPVKAVAEQAGQLMALHSEMEPVALLPDHTASPDDWPQIQAARELGWTAILVTY